MKHRFNVCCNAFVTWTWVTSDWHG